MKEKTSPKPKIMNNSSSQWKSYRRLFEYVKPSWSIFFVVFFGYAMYSAANAYYAEILQQIVDYVSGSGQLQSVFALPSWMEERLFIVVSVVVASILRGLGNFLGIYAITIIANRVVQTIRAQLHDHYMRMTSAQYDKQTNAQLLSRINFNAEQLSDSCSSGLIIVMRESLMLLGLLGYMFYQNWRLTLFFLIVMPFVALIMRKAGKIFRKVGAELQKSMANVTLYASEVIRGHQLVKIHGAQEFEHKRFSSALKRLMKQNIKNAKTQGISVPAIQLMLAVVLSVITYIALDEYFLSQFSPGQFVAFFTAAGLMAQPLRQLSGINRVMQKGIVAAEDIFQQIDGEVEKDDGKLDFDSCKGSIEVKNISFAYDVNDDNHRSIDEQSSAPKVLNNISFKIEAGQAVAIVGRSGSGKSTLISLIMRFYDPSNGEILIDGIPIVNIKLSELRKHLAFVSQRNLLFNGSVLDNVTYGEKIVDIDRVHTVLKQAFCEDFVNKLPQQIHTALGDNGTILSGGQAQRLALARALYKNSSILILDEATSALDNESESKIQESLDALLHSKTIIIIAHRLSTVKKADKIIVLDDGQMAEQGSHDQLVQQEGIYQKLYQKDSL